MSHLEFCPIALFIATADTYIEFPVRRAECLRRMLLKLRARLAQERSASPFLKNMNLSDKHQLIGLYFLGSKQPVYLKMNISISNHEESGMFVCVCLRVSACVQVCVWAWKESWESPLDKVFPEKLKEQFIYIITLNLSGFFYTHTLHITCRHTYTHFVLIGRSLSSYWMGPPTFVFSFISKIPFVLI